MTHTGLLAAAIWAIGQINSSAAADPAKPVDLAWHAGAPSPFARVEAPTAILGGKLYLFGGFTSDLDASPQLDVYDPAADRWTRLKDMPTQVTHLNPAVFGGTLWLAGGFKGRHPGPVTNEVWKYDIAADSWSPGPPLPEGRGAGGLAVVRERLHFFGGYQADRNTNSADHWSLPLPDGGEWRREADLPDPRGHIAAAVLGGKLYALGGQYGHDVKQVDVASCHAFDPASGKWTAIASLPDGRSHFEGSTLVHDGKILIAGGRCNSSMPPRDLVADILEYDPAADRWTVIAALPKPLMAPSAGLIDGRLIVSGGGLNNPRPLEAATHVANWPTGRVTARGDNRFIRTCGKHRADSLSVDRGPAPATKSCPAPPPRLSVGTGPARTRRRTRTSR